MQYDESYGNVMSIQEARDKGVECLSKMNEDQKRVFFQIIKSFESRNKLFFLQVSFRHIFGMGDFMIQGPGGTGKTFLYTSLYYYFRSQEIPVS